MNIFKTSTTLLKCIRRAKTINLHREKFNLIFPTTFRHISLAANKYSEITANVPNSELDYTSKYTQYLSKIRSVDEVDFSHLLGNDDLMSLSQVQRLLLLQFSGKVLFNKPVEFRKGLCEKIWSKFLMETLDVVDYNTYLQVCTENEVPVDESRFVSSMKCEPNRETFRLLLENSCVRGDLEGAMRILAIMKDKEYAVDERIFNLLVLGHTINSGLQGGQGVLRTMQSAQVLETSETHWCFLRGLARRKSGKEFFEALENPLLKFDPHHFFEVLLTLGINSNHTWLLEMKRRFDLDFLPRNLHSAFEHVCLDLMHRNRVEIAVEIYSDFIESTSEVGFARLLLEEMFCVNPDVKTMKNVVQYLVNSGNNPRALEEVTELALRNNCMNAALELFADFKVLRAHYFWPVLLRASNERGEVGIISTLKKMVALNVSVDCDTLELYCLPHCDVSNPKHLINRLEGLGLTMRQLLSPMLVILLRNSQIKHAKDLCQEFKLSELSPRLLKALAIAWYNTKATLEAIVILRSICESGSNLADPVGNFLLRVLRSCKKDDDLLQFLKLARYLKKEKLRISTTSSESLSHNLTNVSSVHKPSIQDVIEDLLDISVQENIGTIKHPKNMSLEELECHYIELTNKNMETRGVLRLLIQEHSRLGNYDRIQELQSAFTKQGYDESPGMQAGILKGYIENRLMNKAIEMFHKLKSKHPSFKVDEYKVIDLAALMVEENMFDEAVSILNEYRKDYEVQGGSYIEKNCWRLLKTAKNPEQAQKLLSVLTEANFCIVKNPLLGPVVSAYLKCNDLEGAIAFYSDCAKKFKCTPLQQELMDAALDAKNGDLLQQIIQVSSQVHGDVNTKVTLIAALAEKGLTKSLQKLIMEIENIPKTELKQRCQRWIQQDKLAPLEVLLDASHRLQSNVLDLNIIYLAMMQIYSRRNDCNGALAFVRKLQEKEVIISQLLKKELDSLLSRCKYNFPKKSSASNMS